MADELPQSTPSPEQVEHQKRREKFADASKLELGDGMSLLYFKLADGNVAFLPALFAVPEDLDPDDLTFVKQAMGQALGQIVAQMWKVRGRAPPESMVMRPRLVDLAGRPMAAPAPAGEGVGIKPLRSRPTGAPTQSGGGPVPPARDPVAVGGDICATCRAGDHSGHVSSLGGIHVGCACGWKP